MKTCIRCELAKELDHFNKDATQRDGKSFYCRPCQNGMQKQWRDNNRVKTWGHQLKRFYKMTWDDYLSMLSSQGGGCAICGSTEPGGKSDRFHVDHDHDCCRGGVTCGKCVRGLLCSRCNTSLGHLERFLRPEAIAYLGWNRETVLAKSFGDPTIAAAFAF